MLRGNVENVRRNVGSQKKKRLELIHSSHSFNFHFQMRCMLKYFYRASRRKEKRRKRKRKKKIRIKIGIPNLPLFVGFSPEPANWCAWAASFFAFFFFCVVPPNRRPLAKPWLVCGCFRTPQTRNNFVLAPSSEWLTDPLCGMMRPCSQGFILFTSCNLSFMPLAIPWTRWIIPMSILFPLRGQAIRSRASTRTTSGNYESTVGADHWVYCEFTLVPDDEPWPFLRHSPWTGQAFGVGYGLGTIHVSMMWW